MVQLQVTLVTRKYFGMRLWRAKRRRGGVFGCFGERRPESVKVPGSMFRGVYKGPALSHGTEQGELRSI